MKDRKLSRKDLQNDPFLQFDHWFKEAQQSDLPDRDAVTLATVDSENNPSARCVLLRQYDREGFLFFTHYESEKARHMAHNPSVALCFVWLDLFRQIRICGKAQKATQKESEAYFKTRQRANQIGSWASPQSKFIDSRKQLDEKIKEIETSFWGQEIPLPLFWGGYRVIPRLFEFFQGRPDRMSDRFRYTLQTDKTWEINRIAP